MKALPITLIISLLLVCNIQIIQADSYIDALSIEAGKTSMKANEATVFTDEGPEPAVAPGKADNIDSLSREVSDNLELVLTGALSKEAKQRKLAEIVSTAVKKGHEIDAIQNAVSVAMAELGKQEGIDSETLKFAKKTVDDLVGASKDIAQGDPNDPYIKSLNAELNENLESNNTIGNATILSTVSYEDITTSVTEETMQTIVVLRGESLSQIAGKVYGSVNKYLFLYEANRDQLDNPDLIIVGQILKIPPLP